MPSRKRSIMCINVRIMTKCYAKNASVYAPTMTNPEGNKKAFDSQHRNFFINAL